jgi:tRNA A22 N-methylase
MLKNKLCGRAVITDISAKSLNKAEVLLERYIRNGSCKSVCCDGLKGVNSDIGQVLIAGMGGEEIIKILKESFIPSKFVFQPMKNAAMLRKFLLDSGCKLTRDDLFFDGKYYFIIKGARADAANHSEAANSTGAENANSNNATYTDRKNYTDIKNNADIVCETEKAYTQAELEFGRDSLHNKILKSFLEQEIQKNSNYLLNEMSDDNRKILDKRIKFLQGVYSGEIK